MLVKINNTIVVHGQLPLSLQEIDDINQFMNDRKNQKSQDDWIEKLNIKYNTKNIGPLQLRDWAFPSYIHNRHETNKQEDYCLNNVRNDIIKFMGHKDVDKLRVVVRHCPQNPYVRRNKEDGSTKLEVLINTTTTHEMESNKVSKTYSSKEYKTGLPDYKNQDTIFSITMQCPKPKKVITQIFLFIILILPLPEVLIGKYIMIGLHLMIQKQSNLKIYVYLVKLLKFYQLK